MDEEGRKVMVRAIKCERDSPGHGGLCRWKMGPQAKECEQPLKIFFFSFKKKRKETFSLGAFRKEHSSADTRSLAQ